MEAHARCLKGTAWPSIAARKAEGHEFLPISSADAPPPVFQSSMLGVLGATRERAHG